VNLYVMRLMTYCYVLKEGVTWARMVWSSLNGDSPDSRINNTTPSDHKSTALLYLRKNACGMAWYGVVQFNVLQMWYTRGTNVSQTYCTYIKNKLQTCYKRVTNMLRAYPAAPPPFTSGARYCGVPHMVLMKEFSPAQAMRVFQDVLQPFEFF
jgi:hypothetical protein